MAIEFEVQRLVVGDVVVMPDPLDGSAELEALVVRPIDRTDVSVLVTMRVEGRDDFVHEWPLNELVTVIRGP